MEEKRNNTADNSFIYIVLITAIMAIIFGLSLYLPIIVAALLFIAPIILENDMKNSKPVLSVVMAVMSIAFIIISPFKYSIYIVLVLCTGFCALISYIVWRLFGVKKFSDGILYSVALSVFFGILTGAVIFMIKDKQSFAVEIVEGLRTFMVNSKSFFIEQNITVFYNYIHITNIDEAVSVKTIMDVFTGAVEYGTNLTMEQKMNSIMPYIQSTVNVYSVSAMLVYPAFAGIVTWWRGSYRFYKEQPMSEEIKNLKPKPFSTYTIPRKLVFAVMILLLFSMLLSMAGSNNVILYAANVMQSFAAILLSLQGYAVMEYFMKRSKALKFAAVRIFLMAIITIGSFNFLPMFLGAVDLFINIRLFYTKTQEIKAKMYNRQTQNRNEKKDGENEKSDK